MSASNAGSARDFSSEDDPLSVAAAKPAAPVLYLPTWSRLRIATKQRTQVGRGGDFFEVFQHRDGPVTTVMCDVAGNGPSAAVPVSDVRWVLRQHLARGEGPGAVLAAVNEWLIGQNIHQRLVTALCVRIDVAAGYAEIASAGHLGPFLKAASGRSQIVAPAPALALGILPGEIYQPIAVKLRPDDALVLATDGITDRLATGDDPLGERGLVRQLERAPLSATHICDALLGLDAAHGLDATVVVLQMPARQRRITPVPPRG
jgi:serine phosphatase RsbU (regulator of sigma subunit)